MNQNNTHWKRIEVLEADNYHLRTKLASVETRLEMIEAWINGQGWE